MKRARPAAADRLGAPEAPRRTFTLEDTGFDEVPAGERRHYRRWGGPGDALAANEVLCPVCRVVIRSAQELRTGDRLLCLPCMSELELATGEHPRTARVRYR